MYLLAANLDFNSSFSTLKLIGLIILCIAIIVACYYTTKFVGKKQTGGSGRNFRPIETYRISQNKFLQIVAVGKRYFLIASSKDGISMLAELNESDLELEQKGTSHKNFKAILASLSKDKKDSDSEPESEPELESEFEEELTEELKEELKDKPSEDTLDD